MRRKARVTTDGFTLLEVMIAGVLLSIVGAGTFSAFAASNQILFSAQCRLEAMNTARQYLETDASIAYDNLAGSIVNLVNPRRRVTTTVQNGPAGTDYRIVTVQVRRRTS